MMAIDLEQASAKYIGQLSNGNVRVTRKWDAMGKSPDCVIAACRNCDQWDMIVITPNCGPFSNPAVEEFCKRHRHEPVPEVTIKAPIAVLYKPDSNYRKFRDE